MEAATLNKFNARLNWLLAIAIIALLLLWETQRERLAAIELPQIPKVTPTVQIKEANKQVDKQLAHVVDSLARIAKLRSDSIRTVRGSLLALQGKAKALESLLRQQNDCDSALLNDYIANNSSVDSTGWRLVSIYEQALNERTQELAATKLANRQKDSLLLISTLAADSLRTFTEDQQETIAGLTKKSKRKDLKTGISFGLGILAGVLLTK